jgi:hypothetical protein
MAEMGLVTLRAMIKTPASASATALQASTVNSSAVLSMPRSICV